MAPFQPQVPEPSTDDLPGLLPTGALTTPAIGIVLLIFISPCRFKRPAMQIQRHHISSRESGRRHSGQEEFVDHSSARHANPAFRCTCWMRGNHHAGALLAAFVQGLIGAIIERAHDPAFRMGELLIGREREPGLNSGLIQDTIVFAARDRAHVGEIHENRFGPIVAIQSHDGTRDRQMAGTRIALDDREGAAQFDALLAMARIAKAGEPVVSLGLENGRPCSSHLPTLASGVAWGAQRTQAWGWVWPILGLRQGPLASSLTGAIDIEDADRVALSVEPSIRLLLFRERPREQVAQEERAQGFHGALVAGGEKAAECRTSRQAVTPKERQERVSPRLDLLVTGFQGPFAADRRAEENGDNSNDIVMSEASASNADRFFDGGKHTLTLHVMNDQSDFPEPAGQRRGHLSARLDVDRRGRDTGQRSS
jgi:hypothetical protein